MRPLIQIDTREHSGERERIEAQLDELGVGHFASKLYVGDYCSIDNPRLVIDRKKDLQELCGNVTQQHERFRNELIRAREANIKIVVLVEHGGEIESLSDVFFWENPRRHEMRWRTVDGVRIRDVASRAAIDGPQLYKSLKTIAKRYGVRFEFCSKARTGKKIAQILGVLHDGGGDKGSVPTCGGDQGKGDRDREGGLLPLPVP